MKLTFCLFRYFPFGGMQYNFRRIAELCVERDHAVSVYTLAWQGDRLPGCDVIMVPERGSTQHARRRHYARYVAAHIGAHAADLRVGFDKMPGLDVYYAADSCRAQLLHGFAGAIKRVLPRYRQLLEFETAIFGAQSSTRIMLTAAGQRAAYQQHYHTADQRFLQLPPGIRRDCVAGDSYDQTRTSMRRELGASNTQQVLLALGSGFRTKGLARSLQALAALPQALRQDTLLLVAGQDNDKPFVHMARTLGLQQQVRFLGGRDDVPRLLFAADLLLHPALDDAGPMVLLEAAAAGLPVLASGVCGNAHYVREHGFGVIVEEPFDQTAYVEQLQRMLCAAPSTRRQWSDNGKCFAATADIYDRARHAVDFFESLQP